MKNLVAPLIVAIACLAASSAESQTSRIYSKPAPPIATHKGVELTSLLIKRQKTGDAAKDAAASTMEVQLYLGNVAPEELWRTRLRIAEIAPLEDDTGKLLSTKERLEALPALREEVTVKVQRRSAETAGAVLEWTVDAPHRSATRLRLFAGKAILTHSRLRHVRFMEETAAHLSGKPLAHPKLGSHKLVPTLVCSDDITTLTVTTPADFPRLISFGLLDEMGKPGFIPAGSGLRRQGDIVEHFHRYRGDQTAGTHLVLNVAEDDEPQVISFEFTDIELP